MAGTRRRLVRVLRVGLPVAALALLGAIFLFPSPEISGVSVEGMSVGGEGLRLERPRFSGEDADGRPFVVTADWALPDGPDPEEIALGPLEGQARADAERALTLEAGGGVLRVKEERLRLEEGVAVETSDGWRLTASAAEVDLDAGTLDAVGPVEGSGPMGRLTAAAMRAERRPEGAYVRFEGGVTLRIRPGAAQEEDEE